MSQADTFPPRTGLSGMAGGAVGGVPLLLVRGENLAILIAATIAYRACGGAWWYFGVLFFSPDLSMLGYLAGKAHGARLYNLVHSYILPAVLAAASWWMVQPALERLALIWCAHIGFDRALGYGLKYASGFGDTHLGPIGARRKPS